MMMLSSEQVTGCLEAQCAMNANVHNVHSSTWSSSARALQTMFAQPLKEHQEEKERLEQSHGAAFERATQAATSGAAPAASLSDDGVNQVRPRWPVVPATQVSLAVTVLVVIQQVYRQQQQIGALAQEVQGLAGGLDQQVKRWAATAAKLDRGLRDLGDFQNLLQVPVHTAIDGCIMHADAHGSVQCHHCRSLTQLPHGNVMAPSPCLMQEHPRGMVSRCGICCRM